MVDNQAYVDIASFLQNDSYNKILRFGTPSVDALCNPSGYSDNLHDLSTLDQNIFVTILNICNLCT